MENLVLSAYLCLYSCTAGEERSSPISAKLSLFTNNSSAQKQQVITVHKVCYQQQNNKFCVSRQRLYHPSPSYTFSSHTSLKQLTTGSMYPIFYMICGIILLLLLPSFLAPGLFKKQGNSKQFMDTLVRHKLKQKPCKEHKLKDMEVLLMLVTILNIGVLITLCAMVNELLLRTSHFRRLAQEGGGPPSYEEATRRHPSPLHHSLSPFNTGGT